MAGSFDVFVTQQQPLVVVAPKSGGTGDFDIFVTQQQPFCEYANATLAALTVSVTDAVAVAEAVTRQVTSFVSTTDAVAVAETVNTTLAHNTSVSDAIAVAETVTRLAENYVSVSEAVAVAETLTELVTSFVSASESVTVAESVGATKVFNASVSDAVTVAETTTVAVVAAGSVAVATTRVAVPTATGVQTITTSDLGGLTPVAALLIVSYATADGTAADNAMLAVGAVTGASNRWFAYMTDEHAAATSDTYNGSAATKAIGIINPADGTTDGEADFSAWVSNGIQINWTDAPAAAYLLTAVFFAGSDVSAHANSVALGNTVDVAVDVTAPGFRPSLVIAAVASQTAELSLGFVHEDGAGTVVQRAVTSLARDGQATMGNLTMYRNDAGAIEIGMGGALVWYGEFGAFDSSGFSLTPRTAGANSRTLNYLALSFGGTSSWVGTHTTPTATNSAYADTGPGFRPQMVLLMPNLNEANATTASDSRALSWGLSALDSNEQYTTVISSEDNAANANTQSLSDNVAVSLPDHAGALDIEATLVSFDTTGWTLNYSNIFATAKLWPALAIQEGAASGGTYSVSVSDAVALTESVTVARIIALAVAESIALSETVTAQITGTLNISVSDSVSITGGPVGLLLAIQAEGESVSVNLVTNVGASDAIALAEATIRLVESYISKSEAITVAEATTATVSAPQVSVTDSIAVSESISLVIPIPGTSIVNVNESITVSEVTALTVSAPQVSVTDAVAVTDTPAMVITPLYLTVADAVSVADSASVFVNLPAGTYAVDLAEGISIGELVTMVVLTMTTPTSRTLSIGSENRTLSIGRENRTLSIGGDER